MSRKLLSVVLLVVMVASGCGARSTAKPGQISSALLDEDFRKVSIVEPLTQQRYPVVATPDEIELYYVEFKAFTKPDIIIDWEYHYVVAPASKPKVAYKKIAMLTAYLPERDDVVALNILRAKASEAGANAVVDIFRKPLHTQRSEPGGFVRIDGYAYLGTAVLLSR